ncbi:Holliday junction branch migration protein RuvA [Chloroflexota bacterium]
MISSLSGQLEALGAGFAVINVNGIGFQVYTPTSTLASLGTIGHEVKLYTHLHLREDNVTLYGFAADAEMALFETLLGVSGLGPRLALAMLSAMTTEQITTAIATGSTDLLMMIPGIGKKVASRIVLELKDKIGAGFIAAPTTGAAHENADVLSALVSLGYSVAEATSAVLALPAGSDLGLEDRIKQALRYLGGK